MKDRIVKLGPTGDFPPEGPLNAADKGGLNAAIGIQDNKLVIVFGVPVTWLALSKSDALALAAILTERAATLPDDVKQ